MRTRVEAGSLSVTPEEIVLPGYLVGMFAVALALLSRPKTIYVAGFDGFPDGESNENHREMQGFWDLLRQTGSLEDVELVSVTPTRYRLPTRSIYGLIQ